jgi:hypothetical protein
MPAPGQVIGTAVAFVWLGMVLAISFLETPLKFRAPGITLPLGLGIGRLVFRALNTVEVVLAAALITALLTITPGAAGMDAARRHDGTAGHPDRSAAAAPGPTSPTDHHRSPTTPLATPPDLHRPGMPQGRDAHHARSPPGHHLVNAMGRKVPAAAQHPGKIGREAT